MVKCLVDTGSDYSLIKREAVVQIEEKIQPAKNVPPLQGVTGRRLRILGMVRTVVRVGGSEKPITLIVVPDNYLSSPILLGMDILGKNANNH